MNNSYENCYEKFKSTDIGSIIVKKINEKNGLFLGVGHKDALFNEYLFEFFQELSKNKKIVIFAEINKDVFSSYCLVFAPFKELKISFSTIYNLLKEMITDPASSIEFLALLLTLHLSNIENIEIIPFEDDPVSKEEKEQNEHTLNVLYGKSTNINLNDVYSATAQRVSGDESAAEKIKQSLPDIHQDKKYIIIGGPAHVKISIILQIDALNVMPDYLYRNILILLSAHPRIIQDLCSKDITSFSYNENSMKPVCWDWDNMSEEEINKLVSETNSTLQNNQFEEKKEKLKTETLSFFGNSGSINPQWKDYPTSMLAGKYIGHKLCFFTMVSNDDTKARAFTTQLRNTGFDVELRKVRDKPSFIVDLNTSTLTS